MGIRVVSAKARAKLAFFYIISLRPNRIRPHPFVVPLLRGHSDRHYGGDFCCTVFPFKRSFVNSLTIPSLF